MPLDKPQYYLVSIGVLSVFFTLNPKGFGNPWGFEKVIKSFSLTQ